MAGPRREAGPCPQRKTGIALLAGQALPEHQQPHRIDDEGRQVLPSDDGDLLRPALHGRAIELSTGGRSMQVFSIIV